VEAKRDAESVALEALLERRKALAGGDVTAATGDSANTVQARLQATRKALEGEEKAVREYVHRITDLRIAAIQDQGRRELAAIDEKYRRELEAAEEAEADKAALDKLREAWRLESENKQRALARATAEEQVRFAGELAAIRLTGAEQTYQVELAAIRDRAEVERRIARIRGDAAAVERANARERAELEAAAGRERLRLADREKQIASANAEVKRGIEDTLLKLNLEGRPLDLAQNEMARQRALEGARNRGEDEGLVNRLYDLQQQLLEIPRRTFSAAGGFSAGGLERGWTGTLTTDPTGELKERAQRILEQVREIVRLLRQDPEAVVWG